MAKYPRMQKGRIPKEPFITWFAKQREIMAKEFILESQKRYGRDEFRMGESPITRSAFASQFDRRRFASWCGIDLKELEILEKMIRTDKQRKYIDFKLMDRVMSTLARPDLVAQWYPYEAFDHDGRWIGLPTDGDGDDS